MRRFRTLALTLAFVVAGVMLRAQLPGPPVGAPQTNQNFSRGYNFQYNFTPSTTTGSGFSVNPTLNLTTATGQNDDVMNVTGTVVLPNSSTSVTQAAGLHVGTLVATLNSGTVTNAANMVVDAAPITGTNAYSIWNKGNMRVDGGILTGGQANIQSSASLGGSPVTLTAAQCGQAFALDVATGVVYLMPSTFGPVGCTYDFYTTVSVTSNAHEVETNNAAHFLEGTPIATSVTAGATSGFPCNGTTHIAYKTNGTTTGGLLGSHWRVTVTSATVAWIDGVNHGSGTLATACSTTN